MNRAPGYRVELDTPQGGRVIGTVIGAGSYTAHDLALVAENLSVAAHGALPPPSPDARLKLAGLQPDTSDPTEVQAAFILDEQDREPEAESGAAEPEERCACGMPMGHMGAHSSGAAHTLLRGIGGSTTPPD